MSTCATGNHLTNLMTFNFVPRHAGHPPSNLLLGRIQIVLVCSLWALRSLLPPPVWLLLANPNWLLQKMRNNPPILTIGLLDLPTLAMVVAATILWPLVMDLFCTSSTAWSTDLVGSLFASNVVDH